MARKIIDLSYPLHPGMPTYPTHWHPFTEVQQLGRHGIENRETRKLTLGTHTGTHCDAPRHFVPGGDTIEKTSLDICIGPARVLDLTSLGSPLQAVGPDVLERCLGSHSASRLLLRYDWSDRWGTLEFFTEHPFLTVEAAHWLLDRQIRLVGMDTPSPDDPRLGWKSSPDSPVHHVLLPKGVVLVEYLCNVRALSRPEVELIALPLKIVEGDGSPIRCVAIEEP